MKLIYIVQVSSPNLINHGDALDCGAAMVPLRRIIILNMTNDANDMNTGNRSLKSPDQGFRVLRWEGNPYMPQSRCGNRLCRSRITIRQYCNIDYNTIHSANTIRLV